MKRTNHFAAALLCILMAAALVIPASAHGCHGGRARRHHSSQPVSVAVCPYEDCTLAGRHSHDGVTYCGYHHDSGLCDNTCRALCPLEDCTLTGRHLHGYTTYCGSQHDCGFCDNSCAVSTRHGCGHGC